MDDKNMQKEKKKWKSDGAISWNVDFEVVDDVGIGFEKKEVAGLEFHELRVEMLMMIWRDRLKNVNCTGLEKWVWQWW